MIQRSFGQSTSVVKIKGSYSVVVFLPRCSVNLFQRLGVVYCEIQVIRELSYGRVECCVYQLIGVLKFRVFPQVVQESLKIVKGGFPPWSFFQIANPAFDTFKLQKRIKINVPSIFQSYHLDGPGLLHLVEKESALLKERTQSLCRSRPLEAV